MSPGEEDRIELHRATRKSQRVAVELLGLSAPQDMIGADDPRECLAYLSDDRSVHKLMLLLAAVEPAEVALDPLRVSAGDHIKRSRLPDIAQVGRVREE